MKDIKKESNSLKNGKTAGPGDIHGELINRGIAT